MRDVFPLAAGIANPAGGHGGRNLQRQKGGILSVIIYREGTTPSLCSVTIPQIQQLKTTNIEHLIISVGQESGHSIAGSSASGSHKAIIKVVFEVSVSFEAWLEKNPLQAHVVCIAFSSLWVIILRARFLLAAGQRPFSVLWLMHFANMATCFLKARKGKGLLERPMLQLYMTKSCTHNHVHLSTLLHQYSIGEN